MKCDVLLLLCYAGRKCHVTAGGEDLQGKQGHSVGLEAGLLHLCHGSCGESYIRPMTAVQKSRIALCKNRRLFLATIKELFVAVLWHSLFIETDYYMV